MPVSTPNQTAFEAPSTGPGDPPFVAPSLRRCVAPDVEVGDPPLRIYATREGDRVTGRVEFPYEVSGRSSVPIDYRNARISDEATKRRSDEGSDLSFIPQPSSLGGSRRLDAVLYYRQLIAEQPKARRSKLLEQTRQAFGRAFGISSLRIWNSKYELEGEAGLRDRYTPRPRKVLALDPRQATEAVTICAWWAYRIANVELIDSKMMYAAAGLLVATKPRSDEATKGYSVADVLATIDNYYAYPCNRDVYRFKPFIRWAKYDIDKWVLRTCERNDELRARDARSRQRTREVLHEPNRTALRAMSDEGQDTPDSVAPSLRRSVASSVAESLALLPDSYRSMLLDAARGDRGCRAEAVATLAIWWEAMPKALRQRIDAKIEAWQTEHPQATEAAAADRKVKMFLPNLLNRSSFTGLALAARLPL